jgi:hypothetical protein
MKLYVINGFVWLGMEKGRMLYLCCRLGRVGDCVRA